ncbi:hypothetical protein BDW75DRAFT_160987 [Aspergillus navahoensis]
MATNLRRPLPLSISKPIRRTPLGARSIIFPFCGAWTCCDTISHRSGMDTGSLWSVGLPWYQDHGFGCSTDTA